MILDLSLHRTVELGASSAVSIAPGASLGDVYQVLYKRLGATLPAGTCAMVGAGGHIAGGGYWLLSRLHGLTIDWLSAVDILTIDASGKVVEHRISQTRDPDLFRACRGVGGGNFGLITAFRFDRLPAAPREVVNATLRIFWESMTEARFTELLTAYGDYFAARGRAPDTFGLFTILHVSPRGSPGGISLHAQFCTPDGRAEDLSTLYEFFARFANFGSPEITRLPWFEATLAVGGSGGGARAKYKSAYMKASFTPAECAAIWHFFTSPELDPRGSFLSVDSYDGAVNTPARIADTAIAQRASVLKLQWQCYWTDPKEDAGRLKFMENFFTPSTPAHTYRPSTRARPWGRATRAAI